MKTIWSSDGPAWSSEGMRQAQSSFRLWVPYDTPAAMSEPTNQSALKREVMMGRSFGYASSPISDEPAMMQKGMPKPRMKRAPTYMPATTC